jgi:hypothetical protein
MPAIQRIRKPKPKRLIKAETRLAEVEGMVADYCRCIRGHTRLLLEMENDPTTHPESLADIRDTTAKEREDTLRMERYLAELKASLPVRWPAWAAAA